MNMKNKRPLMLLLLACCLAQPVFGAKIYGVRDCGEWINRKKNPYSELAVEAWLAGYMSGLSVMHHLNGNKNDPLGKTNSVDQIFLWMDNYCQKNPLSDIPDGGNALFIELMKRK